MKKTVKNENYPMAISILSCMVMAGCSAGKSQKSRLKLPMCGLFHPDPVMCGSAVKGNTRETVITGGKGPGSNPGRSGHGNQDIGKTKKRVTMA
jgi:hypothetical protein